METRAFSPLYLRTAAAYAGTLLASITVAATTSAVPSAQIPVAGSGVCQIQISNTTASWCYVNFGVFGSVTAATVASSYPVAPGAVVVVSVDNEVNAASVILATGTGNVIFTRGEGL